VKKIRLKLFSCGRIGRCGDALRGKSEGLPAELRQDGISVSTMCPGLMRTGSARNDEFKARHRDEYALISISAALPIHARTAAQRIIETCRNGERAAIQNNEL